MKTYTLRRLTIETKIRGYRVKVTLSQEDNLFEGTHYGSVFRSINFAIDKAVGRAAQVSTVNIVSTRQDTWEAIIRVRDRYLDKVVLLCDHGQDPFYAVANAYIEHINKSD